MAAGEDAARRRSWDALERIEDALVTPKVLYFFAMSVFATLYVFRYEFLGSNYLGLDDKAYDVITAAMAAAGTLGATFWSWLADRLRCHRAVFVLVLVGTAASLEPFHLWIENMPMPQKYWVTLAAMVLHALVMGGVLPMTDYFTMQILKRRGAVNAYGKQCFFGTLSYAVVTYVVGLLFEGGHIRRIFLVQRATALLTILSVFLVPSATLKTVSGSKDLSSPTHDPSGGVKTTDDQRISKWERLLLNPHFMFMLLAVSIIGFSRGVMTVFLSKYCAERLSCSPGRNSVAAICGILFEAIIFPTGPHWLRICGAHNMFLLAQLAMSIRAWSYVLFPLKGRYYAICAIELLKGIGYGMTQIAGTRVALERSPPGLEATALALYTAVYSQIPVALAALLGLFLGIERLFQMTAALITLSALLCTGKYLVEPRAASASRDPAAPR